MLISRVDTPLHLLVDYIFEILCFLIELSMHTDAITVEPHRGHSFMGHR